MSITTDLIKSWLASSGELDAAERALANAKSCHEAAINELGERLLPDADKTPGDAEQVGIWVDVDQQHEQLLIVKVLRPSYGTKYSIKFEGKKRKKWHPQ